VPHAGLGRELKDRAGTHPAGQVYGERLCGELSRRLRDECLNTNRFRTLNNVRTPLAGWRQDYNSERPHTTATLEGSGKEQAVQILLKAKNASNNICTALTMKAAR
jgi:hypothetical protein